MPYALFINNEQISKAYKTEHEVWNKADEAGLVVEVASDEEKDHPRRVLDEDYSIKSCPADTDQPPIQNGLRSEAVIQRRPGRAKARAAKQTGRRVLASVK